MSNARLRTRFLSKAWGTSRFPTLPGGIRTTLAIALLLIVGGALAGAYVMVVPSLERRLVDERLDELQRDANVTALGYVRRDFSNPLALDDFVDGSQIYTNGRVVIFQAYSPPLSLRTIAVILRATAMPSGRSE